MKSFSIFTLIILTFTFTAVQAALNPVNADGEKAMNIIVALSDSGVPISDLGIISILNLSCRGNTGGGSASSPSDPRWGIGYQSCYIENNPSAPLAASRDLVNALEAVGVEQAIAQAGHLFVAVDHIDCKVDASKNFYIGAQRSINPQRFACIISGVNY
jgi:hypothetical protein